VLLLDYDGTLAPFRVERDEAVPYAGVREAVRELLGAAHTRVVVVSGRTVTNLRPLLGVEPPPELWGTHGWERMEPAAPSAAASSPPARAPAWSRRARRSRSTRAASR
jgi:trehalose-phosphatase